MKKSEKRLDMVSYAWILYSTRWKWNSAILKSSRLIQQYEKPTSNSAIYFNYCKTITILNWTYFSGKFHIFQYNKSINNSSDIKTT